MNHEFIFELDNYYCQDCGIPVHPRSVSVVVIEGGMAARIVASGECENCKRSEVFGGVILREA